MNHIQIDIMNDASEIVHYDNPAIPIYIKKGLLSYYPGKRAVCHWHDDFEIILVLSGEMNYYINGQILQLKPSDVLWVNSKVMHYGFSKDNKDCEFICILFHPSILSANKYLSEKIISDILISSPAAYLLLNPDDKLQATALIHQIFDIKKAQEPFYELDIIGLLYSLTTNILRIYNTNEYDISSLESDDILMLRKMVSFIHNNYQNMITLKEIGIFIDWKKVLSF